jgi:S-formylglutathione hydrolase
MLKRILVAGLGQHRLKDAPQRSKTNCNGARRVPLAQWPPEFKSIVSINRTDGGRRRAAAEKRQRVARTPARPDTPLVWGLFSCTSPRGEAVANDAAYDLGQGASFYVDATQSPWAQHFRMESYITADLPEALSAGFALDLQRTGLAGHSMGGHGALTLALRHPQRYRSVSAFSPIVSPTRCPWGVKAFTNYLGDTRSQWTEHDATCLIEAGAARGHYDEILVDQGLADQFLVDQLQPQLLVEACAAAGQKLTLRQHAGYDHSYYFIASFMADHIAFHAARLG